MADLSIRPASACRFDAVSLGEVMLRLDPGEGRIRTARTFAVWEGGGEYNVARGLRRAFGLRTGVVTALADNEIGHLVEDLILTGGLDTSLITWVPYDGIGRGVRNGLNFTERGFGVRGAVGVSDRGHTAASLERDHADERRQNDRKGDQGPEGAPARKFGPLEEERERDPDRGRQQHRRERDPQARPERLPLIRTMEELREVPEAPSRRPQRLPKRQQQGIADQPRQQQREQRPGDYPLSPREREGVRARLPPSRQLFSFGYTLGSGPAGSSATNTLCPGRAASGEPSTSTAPLPSSETSNRATRPA